MTVSLFTNDCKFQLNDALPVTHTVISSPTNNVFGSSIVETSLESACPVVTPLAHVQSVLSHDNILNSEPCSQSSHGKALNKSCSHAPSVTNNAVINSSSKSRLYGLTNQYPGNSYNDTLLK